MPTFGVTRPQHVVAALTPITKSRITIMEFTKCSKYSGKCQTACKPGSVPPPWNNPGAVMAIPLGHSLPSASCDRPERRREGSPGISGYFRNACRSYLVLLPVGFSLPPPSPAARCALTAPFHPCRPRGFPRRAGGILSVALSLGSPPPGVTRHRTSVEPGLSSPRHRRRAAIRPSGNKVIWVPAPRLSKARG